MNIDKLNENLESVKVIEELIFLSQKVFGKNSDEVKKVVEMFISKSYLLGKRNMMKVVDD